MSTQKAHFHFCLITMLKIVKYVTFGKKEHTLFIVTDP